MSESERSTNRRCFFSTLAATAMGGVVACKQGSDAPAPAAAKAAPATPAAPAAPAAKPKAPAAPASSGLPKGLDARDFVVHGTTPLNLETRRDRFTTGPITPISRTYVRANLPLPSPTVLDDADAWRLSVSGVKKPGSISLRMLKALGLDTVTAVLQCSGNGRAFFEHKPSGSPWTVGAAANLMWTGLRLSTLIEHLGGLDPAAKAAFVTGTGGEPIPPGLEAKSVMVERSIPLKKALKDAILAWEVNGEPISLEHGGPLRLVVPGYYGVNFVKYLKQLSLSQHESDAKIQKSSYRVRPVGKKGGPDQPSMWQMPVKSFLFSPSTPTVLAGVQRFVGAAFSGAGPITKVELSVDGGRSWKRAKLASPDLGPFAWRVFSLETKLTNGDYRLVSRASDASGAVQPKTRANNHRGYGNNSWQDMGIDVKVRA